MNSGRAIFAQVITISIYVLVAILKKELHVERSLGKILQILSVTPFEKMILHQLLSDFKVSDPLLADEKQLLFNIS